MFSNYICSFRLILWNKILKLPFFYLFFLFLTANPPLKWDGSGFSTHPNPFLVGQDGSDQLCHLTQHIKTKFVRKEKIITPNMKEHSKDNGIIGNKDGISGF